MLAIVAPVAIPWVFGPEWGPAVAPTQVLAIGGAAVIMIDAAGATLMAAARPRAVLGFGWAHFAAYATAVFFTAPLGLTAVAAAAATVHTAFVFVAYSLMFHRAGRDVVAQVWKDVAPALCSSAALVAVSLPASVALTAMNVAPLPYLAVVGAAGSIAYLLALRVGFARTWRTLVSFLSRLHPPARAAPPARSGAGRRAPGRGGRPCLTRRCSGSRSAGTPRPASRAPPACRAGRPGVSVVVPCYNYGHFLGACVDSVLTQAGVDVDVLIVDDASPDGSRDVAEAIAAREPRVRVLRNPVNRGNIATYNIGLERVEGTYVLLLSADDMLTPGALSRAVALMERHPPVGFVYGGRSSSRRSRRLRRATRTRSWLVWKGDDWLRDNCRRATNVIRSSDAVIRRSVLERVGGYREDLPHSGDHECGCARRRSPTSAWSAASTSSTTGCTRRT